MLQSLGVRLATKNTSVCGIDDRGGSFAVNRIRDDVASFLASIFFDTYRSPERDCLHSVHAV